MRVTALPVLGAADWGGEFEGALEPINYLFAFPPIVEITVGPLDLSISRTILIAWFMTLVVGVFFAAAFAKPEVVPGRLQNFAEAIVDFVRNGIAREIIGPKGDAFVPLLTTFMVTIFLLNLAKITPFMMMPPTGRMAWPAMFAVISWLVFIGVGIKHQGAVGYFKEMAFPPGVPWPAYIILTPIELISNIVLRPFTLAVRLFANMAAGHILIVITLTTIHVFLPSMPVGWTVGVFGLIASPVVFGFELLVITLQAYIFTMLTAVYISSSMEAH